MRIAIIGGGIFGCCIAAELAKAKYKVDLIEESADIMLHASQCNHNRIHLGYHYLRSASTAEQSLEGLLSFMFQFGNSVLNQFDNYYAIANQGSHTNAVQFIDFCNKVGIGYDEEYPEKKYLNRDFLEACFKVPEPIFDYHSIKNNIELQLNKWGVNVMLNNKCESITNHNGLFTITTNTYKGEYDFIINATYASINNINNMLGIASRKLLFEDVAVPIFEHQAPKIGLTIMDGPFCSVMPKGFNENQFLLYHVKESVLSDRLSEQKLIAQNTTANIEKIVHAATPLMPFLAEAKWLGYWRTIRTVHENSDDARLSEVHYYETLPNYISVLSGKITTCIQTAIQIKHFIQGKKNNIKFKV
jgi:hypothetical protein